VVALQVIPSTSGLHTPALSLSSSSLTSSTEDGRPLLLKKMTVTFYFILDVGNISVGALTLLAG